MKRLFFWILVLTVFWLTLVVTGYIFRIPPEVLAGGGLAGLLLVGGGGVFFLAVTGSKNQKSENRKISSHSSKSGGVNLFHLQGGKPPAENTPVDENRRLFLKTVGSLSVGALLLAIFKKDAAALSFGGTGYPDPVGLKNAAGTAIDPATETKQDTLIAKFPFEDYQYMGSQTVGSYVFYGFKQNGGTGWYIMRKNTSDDSAWTYAYSSDGGSNWITAWGAPDSQSYNDPPDS